MSQISWWGREGRVSPPDPWHTARSFLVGLCQGKHSHSCCGCYTDNYLSSHKQHQATSICSFLERGATSAGFHGTSGHSASTFLFYCTPHGPREVSRTGMVSADEEVDPKRLSNMFQCIDTSHCYANSGTRFLVPSSRFLSN